MKLKRLLPLLLTLLLLPIAAPAQTGLRGYDAKAGISYLAFGAYPALENGEAAPILWRVLSYEKDVALLLSDQVLLARAAHEGSAYRGFEHSSLAAFLQEDFLQAAFDAAQQDLLLTDELGLRVGLPTASMLRDKALGFARDADRVAQGTDHARAQGLLLGSKLGAHYWMADRSQSMQNGQRRVLDNGVLGYIAADAPRIGVRPVIRLDVSRVNSFAGSGTKEDPFTFQAGDLPVTPAPTATPVITPSPVPSGMMSLEGFPPLVAPGFLPEGEPEYVFIDEENGIWRFANQELRIEITRHEDPAIPLRWLGAEIFLKEGARPFRMVSHDKEHMLEDRSRYLEKPAVIMRNNNLVFSMDGDYFIYRLGRAKADGKKYAIGVEIRDHEILVDIPPSAKRNTYPPLDMMALFPDGDMRVYAALEHTAQELVAMGAQDVLSFGPWLIRDGVINDTYKYYGTTLQPRAAVGMVEKGHYWAVIVEGRIRPSKGMTTMQVAELMAELGCTQAFNLDGGWTSAMVFMGKQLNQLDRYGVSDNARTQNEVMGIGYTDAYLEGRAP